jgi:hypothetical protein
MSNQRACLELGLLACGLLASTVVGIGALPARGGPTDVVAIEFFEKEIRPLLAANCQKCHGGGEKVRGGLRLIGPQQLLKGGESGPAVVPGKPEQSLLIQAVVYRGELRMPPKGKLSAGDIARLRRWVALGAPWPETAKATAATPNKKFQITEQPRRWWAYQPIRSWLPPTVKDASWPRSPIDRFILAELEAHGIAPAPPADKRTLLRRVTFDLTGLPPAPEEVEAFVADSSPEAFARVVDRLLASSAYGERWGRHWLDVARYADYYQADPHEHGSAGKFELFEAYRYRDWVVEAFNRDLPYDQFVVQQIAGDLLPGPSGQKLFPEGIIATAFLALGSWDHGDADKEKLVSDIVDDQIDTVGKAFLGLTLGCARCHDHKFEPISQEDYYALAGIFYSTHILANVGAKGDHSVIQRVPLAPAEYLHQRERQTQRLDELDQQLTRLSASFAAALLGPQALAASPAVARRSGELVRLERQKQKLEAERLPPPP